MKVKVYHAKIYHANINQRKARVGTVIPNKVDFKAKKITRDREGHYIMKKGTIYQEDIYILNVYVQSCKISKEKTVRTERIYKQIYKYSWRLQNSSPNN